MFCGDCIEERSNPNKNGKCDDCGEKQYLYPDEVCDRYIYTPLSGEGCCAPCQARRSKAEAEEAAELAKEEAEEAAELAKEEAEEADSLKQEIKTLKEQLKTKEEEEEAEKESFQCCHHIDESGWTTKHTPNYYDSNNAYHNEEYCGCRTDELEPVQPAEYYGRIVFNCECMIGDTFKGLQSHTFTILCDACKDERFHPKSCLSCEAKQTKTLNYPIVLDAEGFCQHCIKNGGREEYLDFKREEEEEEADAVAGK